MALGWTLSLKYQSIFILTMFSGTTVHIVVFVITARCHASAVYAVAVCLSVCLLQIGIVLKRLNITQTTPIIIAPELWFSDAEDLCKTQPESPPTEATNAGGVG